MSYKGETHLKMTTRARAIHLKHQNQHLLCKADKIDLNCLALNRLSKIRLFSSSYDRKDVDLHLSFPSDAQQTQSVTAG